MTLIVASYLSPRPKEFGPRAHSYTLPLMLLDESCRRAGCTHVCITEPQSADLIPDGILHVPVEGTEDLPLMQAIIAGQLTYLREQGIPDEGLIFVGADCLITRDPREAFAYPEPFDIGVTVGIYSPGGLNSGGVYFPPGRDDQAVDFYSRCLSVCDPEWGADQESLRRTVLPLVKPDVVVDRHGLRIRFMSMDDYNCPPASEDDVGAARSLIAHFKGNRKSFMADWALKQLGIPTPEMPFIVK